jgi:hypothetical protein
MRKATVILPVTLGLALVLAACGNLGLPSSSGSGPSGTGSSSGGGASSSGSGSGGSSSGSSSGSDSGTERDAATIPTVPLQTLAYSFPSGPVVGQSFVAQLPAAGGTPPYRWTFVSGALPPGLSVTSDGRLVGTPTTAGTYDFVLQLTDDVDASATGLFTETLVASGTVEFVLVVPTLPDFGENGQVGFLPAVQGPEDTLPWSITISGLPTGLTYDSASGLVSGVATSAGVSQLNISVQAPDGQQASGSPATASLQVNAPGGDGGTSQYDGTYDWFLGPVNGLAESCSSCVSIQNGVVQNSAGTWFDSNIDHFGNLTFDGPCPSGSDATGFFSGMLGGLTRPQWQGTWTCADGSVGGSASPWKIFNQH